MNIKEAYETILSGINVRSSHNSNGTFVTFHVFKNGDIQFFFFYDSSTFDPLYGGWMVAKNRNDFVVSGYKPTVRLGEGDRCLNYGR